MIASNKKKKSTSKKRSMTGYERVLANLSYYEKVDFNYHKSEMTKIFKEKAKLLAEENLKMKIPSGEIIKLREMFNCKNVVSISTLINVPINVSINVDKEGWAIAYPRGFVKLPKFGKDQDTQVSENIKVIEALKKMQTAKLDFDVHLKATALKYKITAAELLSLIK